MKSKLQLKFLLVFGWCLMGFLTGYSQTITGTILDSETGESLIGANILVKNGKGTSTGTITDFDGKYEIQAEKGDTLVFSYTGYVDQSFIIGDGNDTINIQLAESVVTLETATVVGYGAVKKEDLTGVVSKVEGEDFNGGVIASPERLMTGKVAGLQITPNNDPGGKTEFRIRGGTSLDANSQPLIVIDGVPIDDNGNASGRNPLSFVNPADVESITVLKDASAAAIYGSRGANGVIIITTKSGSGGKMMVNYNGYFSVSALAGSPDIFDAENFRLAIADKAPQLLSQLGDANTDWVDEVTQLATGQQHNVSMSGGFGKSNYYVSLNHMYNNGVLKTSRNAISNAAVNLSTKLFDDNLTLSLKSKASLNKDRFAPNVMGAAQTFDPTQVVLDAESEYGGYFQWADPLVVNNPVSSLMLTNEQGEGRRFLNSLDAELKLPFVEGLSIKARGSYDLIRGEKSKIEDPLLKDNENFIRGGLLFTEEEKHYSALFESYLNYKKELGGGRSKLDVIAGYSWQDFDRENRYTTGRNLEKADNEWGYMATEDIEPDSFLVHNRLISFFGRVNYGFDERYLLTLSVRRDGSTRFGKTNRWGLFPSVAFAWRVLQEDFAQGLNSVFTDLKLRVSYGVVGNESIGDYRYETYYSLGADDVRYQFGDAYKNILRAKGVDPNLKWEETGSLNIGVDFGFFNNRLTGSVEFYQKNTRDLLFTVAAPAFTNLSDRILTNIGQMENKGVELTLNTYIIDRDKFDWTVDFNASYNKNEIKKLDNSDATDALYEIGGISGDIGQTIQVLNVGQPATAFRTYRHILDASGNPVPDTEDRNGDGLKDGLDIYEDINGDGMINELDLVIDKKAAPDFILGLTSGITYGKFDLGFTLRSSIGNYVYNNTASSKGYFDLLSDRVTNNIHRSAYRTNFKERQLKSDYYIENGSFLKLDNITLGYTFDEIKFFNNIRLYATAQNVLTLTGYSGLDPEIFNGIDNNIYPFSRTFLFGVNASF